MRRHRKALRPVTEINLTSLLDVAFVLLIAFMIVAPSLRHGLEIDLPTVTEGAPALTAGGTPQSYTIVVPKPGPGGQEYYLNDSPSALRDIETRLRLQRESGAKVAVEIQADREVPYETFVQVVAAVRRAGIEAVGLPVEAGSVKPPSMTKPPTPAPTPAGGSQ
ncbi:MAG: biopolymer transporter ExbD [Candidatus Sumerlaeaceae bacterium]|nr:biopolymer transporter ExbD [Candidatus Sumerlaeaceae bacterium]